VPHPAAQFVGYRTPGFASLVEMSRIDYPVHTEIS
jgi:hypothetical protein